MTGKEIHDLNGFIANTGRICAGIILTHFHWDHILGANHFGHTDIFRSSAISRRAGDSFAGYRQRNRKMGGLLNEKPLKPEAFAVPNHLLEDGNRLQVGETSLLIIPRPGIQGPYFDLR